MASVKPFAALRPKPELASQICELPYDVLSSDEARAQVAGKPTSFFHVSKPEVDLPPGTNQYAPEVYAKGAENFRNLIAQGALAQDAKPCFYLYRQIMGKHSQTGFVAVASCDEYLRGIIKKHELTRPDKEDDRVRHIETLNSQTGPVFLAYRGDALDKFIADKTAGAPAVDFTAKDGVRHTSWTISDPKEVAFVEQTFARIPYLYIADGHHRSAAAGRVFKSRNGAGSSGWFLSVIFPHKQLQILPYNRALKDLNGLTPEQLLAKLESVFTISKGGSPSPKQKHELAFYFQGQWHTLTFQSKFLQTTNPLEKLDVELLQKHILAPVFGIDDPRTSKCIQFVGGIRGPAELEKLVNSGEYACAFSMFPTSMDDLIAVADADGIMPPKSTWFEPKLRDAMFCHMI
ncbi:MAG TPA: DUF1015 family protein [Verrucomicrobiae bacterium]|jgi:uncharacterized protein (DUF1015 family)